MVSELWAEVWVVHVMEIVREEVREVAFQPYSSEPWYGGNQEIIKTARRNRAKGAAGRGAGGNVPEKDACQTKGGR